MKVETKKVRKKRLSFKRLFIFILFLYLIGYSFYYLLKQPIKNIIINGNTYITDKEIIETAKISSYPSIFKVNNKKIKKRLETLSLVNKATVDRNLMGILTIIVDENKPLFYNKSKDTYIYQNGLEEKTKRIYIGIPTLINYVPDKIYKNFIKKLKNVEYNTTLLISEIEYCPTINSENKVLDDSRFLFRMNDTNTVYINIKNLDNVNYYKEVISSFNYNGILYLDTSSEDNFVFSKYK